MNFQKQKEVKVDMEVQEISGDEIYARHLLRNYIMLTKLNAECSNYQEELDDIIFKGNILSGDEVKRIKKLQNIIININRTAMVLTGYLEFAVQSNNIKFTDDYMSIISETDGKIIYTLTDEDLNDYGCTTKGKDEIDEMINNLTKDLNI